MLLPFVWGLVAFVAVPASSCREKEFTTRDGQCCPKCNEGSVVRRDCTQLSGTLCVPCENGTYMNKPNGLRACLPCSTCDAGVGLYVRLQCSSTADTVCGVLSGFFCTSWSDEAAECSYAVKHKVCQRGQRIKEPGTNRSDTVCEDCQSGHFSQDGVDCSAWTVCSETQIKVKEGSSSEDVVCRNASRSHHTLILPFCSLILTLLGLFKVWTKKAGTNK